MYGLQGHVISRNLCFFLNYYLGSSSEDDIIVYILIPVLQLLEAAWCLTNIAAGKPEETKALLPALPLLVAHLGGW